jgi:hypothetical protein
MLSSVCTSSDHDFFVKNDCDNNPEDIYIIPPDYDGGLYILYAHTKYIEIVQI